MPKDPILFRPDGGRAESQLMAEAAHFGVRSDYSLKTGLGHIIFDVPGSAIVSLLQRAEIPLTEEMTRTLLGGVHLKLMPQEAMQLGMRFITEAESAIGQAITLRILIIICEMTPEEAVHALQHVGQDVRENHAMIYQWAIEEKQRRMQQVQEKLAQPTTGKPS